MKEPNNLEEIVPGRPSAAELRAMALRQQQQIDSQHQLLAAKEQRLRFLKTQEVRGAAAAAEGERLRRLRERVEAQESKLRRLRALRGQVDLQKTYNVTLSNDLDSIRALFSEKEKELSLAVAKVEALTRQLEELRRDRRGPLNLIPNGGNGGTNVNGGNQQIATSPAARELEKLRRELMYRNQLSLQQDARLHLQREALQQRQAELRSVDQRILELQNRLQRKKASNLLLQNQTPIINVQSSQPIVQQQQQQPPQQQQQNVNIQNNTNGSGVGGGQIGQLRKPTNIYPMQRIVPRGNNVAAVEPYNHSPKKTAITPTTNTNAITLPQQDTTAATTTSGTATKNASQLIQDLTNMKLNQNHKQLANNITNVNHIVTSLYPESDENKLLARQKQQLQQQHQQQQQQQQQQKLQQQQQQTKDVDFTLEFGPKKTDPKYQTLPYNTKFGMNFQHQQQQSAAAAVASVAATANATTSIIKTNGGLKTNECDSEKAGELTKTNETIVTNEFSKIGSGINNVTGNGTTVHSTPLNTINKSIAIPVAVTTTSLSSKLSSSITNTTTLINDDRPAIKPKAKHQIPSGNLVVPPRKPISSVQPTQMLSKLTIQSPKIHIVTPNTITNQQSSSLSTITTSTTTTTTTILLDSDKNRPALPPKPNKTTTNGTTNDNETNNNNNNNKDNCNSVPTIVSVVSKPPISEPINEQVTTTTTSSSSSSSPQSSSPISQIPMIIDHLPIKARPLTIKKQPLHEQPRLKSMTSGIKPIQYTSRRIEMPPSFLFPAIGTADLKDKSGIQSPNNSSIDETDKSVTSSNDEKQPDEVIRRTRSSLSDNRKEKLSRRVSFDPLALLLDASLEGELELVRKTAMQVTNPSAANDEGITALHNAICAGHFEIVKFLVEFGCDVNAQDSDGWTPLHCAASCNNLSMVKFLVESGACLFAATLSDHETPAEKCEEDEEGFDGCSEYLYSIQEKLGILNNGEVYAVFAYEQQQTDELCFTVNDRLTILRKGDDSEREWWWARTSNNKEGYVPRNLFGLYPRVPLQTQSD